MGLSSYLNYNVKSFFLDDVNNAKSTRLQNCVRSAMPVSLKAFVCMFFLVTITLCVCVYVSVFVCLHVCVRFVTSNYQLQLLLTLFLCQST